MKANFKILLVEDMESFRDAVTQLLGVYNDVTGASSIESARQALQKAAFDVVILDKGLPDGDGISLISEIKDINPNAVVIMLTSDSDFSTVKRCIALGADDYVIKSDNIIPDLLVRIPVAVSKAASNRRLITLEQQVKDAFRYEIVGKSPATMQLRESILDLRGTSAHVLITGESGTGKELIARRLNAIEDDGKRPFVAINCGAIPENLLESELFGHKKGSFTGATQDRPGRFELAHNGDLFLDEIGEMPLSAQVRLLRVIQEGEFTRVGDDRTIKVKCRVIAATNKDLEQMIAEGKFREDLYHRLNVVRIETAPLRLRMEDIPDLARLFTLQIGGANYKIDDKAIRELGDYDWPGNIRELRNIIERACISARRRSSEQIEYDDISIQAPKNSAYRLRQITCSLPESPSDLTPENYREFFITASREYFRAALEAANGNISEIANKIGVGRTTVFRRIQELGLKADKKIAASKSHLPFYRSQPLGREKQGEL
ncbi:MAG: sigma-54-dependent Fis family transcriptional regulator [Bdellovibrionaceae bacterium]|nr:sigma-54-dependent Fis family transcriptional regulator [Pseudobdellovibrionaceae bacterium]